MLAQVHFRHATGDKSIHGLGLDLGFVHPPFAVNQQDAAQMSD